MSKEIKTVKDELIGLTELSSEVLKCGDCGKKLIDIVLTERNDSRENRGLKPQLSYYKVVNCPECKGSSFHSQKYEGTVIIGPIDGNYCIEYEDSDIDDHGYIYNILTLIKK